MMKYLYLPVFVCLATLWSCEEDSSDYTSKKGNSGITYEESFSQWEQLKVINGDSYAFTVSSQSWTGYQSTTTLTVTDGHVTGRSYRAFSVSHPENEETIYEEWTETGDNLGRHANGVPLVTIDDLYETCLKDYLVADELNNTLYFNTDPTGIINTCGYVPDDCTDDCYIGINIDSFSWLNKKRKGALR